MTMMTKPLFVGLGVGPGDPELLTLKALRFIQQADVIAYIANTNGQSQALDICQQALETVTKAQVNLPVLMPMNEDRTEANLAYDRAADTIQQHINAGQQVVFLCEGDPLFFGSFAYLLERLQADNTCQVVPGISSVHAAASSLQLPLTLLKESFAVISGRHNQQQLETALATHDTVVIMKAGRSRARILDAIKASGRETDAHYLEYISRENEYIHSDITCLEPEAGPYFSLFVVIRSERDRT